MKGTDGGENGSNTPVTSGRAEGDDGTSRRVGGLSWLLRGSLTGRELAIAWGALGLLGILTFLPHLLHGGFYLDDWWNAALTLHNAHGDSFGNVVGSFAGSTLFRPLLVLYVPLTYWVFGMHMWLHLAWAAFLGIAVSALLYAVLRTLGLPRIHALAIGALVLVYPWFDSTRLWSTGDQIALSTTFALGGLWLALAGLARDSWKWHVGAAALFLASILTYEITLPSIAAFGLLYIWRFGWSRAKWSWAADLVVVIVGGAWVLSHTPRTRSGLSGDLSHLRIIVGQGSEIVARSLVPVGPQRTALPLILIGVVLALGVVSLRSRHQVRAAAGGVSLAGWLACAAAGLITVVLGWVIFVPADPYYTPSFYGATNRVNGIAGIGAVILVYATFGVVGSLAARVLRQRAIVAGLVVTMVLGAALGIGYVTVIRRHIGIWNAAYQAEATALRKIKAQYPTLPPGTTLFTTNYPANQTWGVPILSSGWDLHGMVKDEYDENILAAAPLLPGYGFVCHPEGMEIRVLGESGAPDGELLVKARTYKSARIFDIEDERAYRPTNQATCRAIVKQLLPGPLILSPSY
jgi:hypothetical protein